MPCAAGVGEFGLTHSQGGALYGGCDVWVEKVFAAVPQLRHIVG